MTRYRRERHLPIAVRSFDVMALLGSWAMCGRIIPIDYTRFMPVRDANLKIPRSLPFAFRPADRLLQRRDDQKWNSIAFVRGFRGLEIFLGSENTFAVHLAVNVPIAPFDTT